MHVVLGWYVLIEIKQYDSVSGYVYSCFIHFNMYMICTIVWQFYLCIIENIPSV